MSSRKSKNRPVFRFSVKLTLWYALLLVVSSLAIHLVALRLLDDEMLREWSVSSKTTQETWSVGDRYVAQEIRYRQTLRQLDPGDFHRQSVYDHFNKVFWRLVAPILLLGLAGGLFLTYSALRPIRRLVRTVGEIVDTGEMSRRVPATTGRGEMNELVRMFNRMLDRNETLIQGMHRSLDNTAHDLRTPMTRLRSGAEFALGHPDDLNGLREALADCLEESDRVLTMLNTLMDVAEAETGVMRLERQPVEVRALVDRVVDLYQFVAEENHATLRTDVPEDLTVSGDRARLEQVLANLVDNAIKYGKPTHNRITIRGLREDENTVVIRVADQGTGIPQDEQPRIWDRLYRGDRSRSRRGLGLGLNFVRAIVEAHDGTVAVESTPGEGSTFTLRLPDPARRDRDPTAQG
jgi:signal transduction histidine kinase